MEKICENCKFFVKTTEDETYGECHRFPPQVLSDPEVTYFSKFSETRLDSWCGEFKESDDVRS